MTMRLSEPGRACDIPALGALAFYLTLSIAFFGRALFGHLSDFYFGIGVDPGLMMWSLVWWPHAIAHGLNPLLTKAFWAPSGFNFAWATSIPLASALVSPLTLALGPVATYNILCLISFPINGFAVFLLCRYITRDYAASLLAGYIFGFSPFMLGQLLCGHLHMMLVFSVPLCVYLVLRRVGERITRRDFTLLLSLLLVAQFLLSLEVFATMTMLGAFALLSVLSFGSDRTRKQIPGLLISIACAYAIAMAVVSPYLYYFLAYRLHIIPRYTPPAFSVYPLNFLIPTPVNELGRVALFRSISAGFVSGWTVEAGAYLGPPLMLVAAAYVRRHLSEPVGKILTYCLAAAIVLSLGPILRVYLPGYSFRIALPWWLLAKLPLLENAITMRFSMYTFLILAVISACYFAHDASKTAGKLSLAATVVLFSLPNISSAFWLRPVDTPEFFRHDVYESYIPKGQIILILPYAYTGNSMIWQAQTRMYFDMAEGPPFPDSSAFLRWPIFPSLTRRAYVPDATEQFQAFIAAHDVETIVVTDKLFATWRGLLSTIDARPTKVADVWLFRVARQPRPDVEMTWRSLRKRFDTERFITLITGAQKYLSDGGNLDSLSVLGAEKLNLIREDSLVGPPLLEIPGLPIESNPKTDPRLLDGVWLGKTPDGLVSVGEQVWYSAIAPMVEQLHGIASGIYYPYPDKLAARVLPTEEPSGWLIMTFTYAQLSQAAALLAARKDNSDMRQTSRDVGRQRNHTVQNNVQ
jgi:hypothetical protein